MSGHRASGRAEDARGLARQIYSNDVELFPDPQNKTSTVRLHHLTLVAHDEAVRHLGDELNATETLFPGTDLCLRQVRGPSPSKRTCRRACRE
ncbi:MAG: putative transposase [Terriglobia bacterium]